MHRLALVLLLGLAMAGCSGPKPPAPPTDYSTVGQDPNRDTELARRHNSEALELMDSGKYDHAEKVLKQALAADVMFGPAHNNLGKVYYHKAQFYLAAWEFEYAGKLMPNQPEPLNNLGLVLEAAGKMEDARKSYERAHALDEANAEYAGNLARARVRLGEHSDSLRELLDQMVMRDPRPEWVRWARAKLALMPKPADVGHTERSAP